MRSTLKRLVVLAFLFAACAPDANDVQDESEVDVVDTVSEALSAANEHRILQVAQNAKSIGDDFAEIVQPVNFVVIHRSDGVGEVQFSALEDQIEQLNRAFAGREGGALDAKIRFFLASVRYLENDDLFASFLRTEAFDVYTAKYGVDPARYLNIYVGPVNYSLGLTWLPWSGDSRESSSRYGVRLHHELLPGNRFKPNFSSGTRAGTWSQGDILTHEVGHHYGLNHLFDGAAACSSQGLSTDLIDDTPQQKGNPFGTCRQLRGRDSCPRAPGVDDIGNYMNTSADSCRDHFTPGQVRFMRAIIEEYKPTLAAQRAPSCVAAVDPSDASPDLAPCLLVKTARNGRKWCSTDPDNASRWAWACCPGGGPWGQESCRQGSWSSAINNIPAPN